MIWIFSILVNFPVRNSAAEAYDVTLKTHVKNVVGEGQLVDLQYLSGENGAVGKVVVLFDRKAAQNNDFKLNVLVRRKTTL